MNDQTREYTVQSCRLPQDLFYDVDLHIWLRMEKDGEIRIGLSDMAQTLAGKLLHISIRKMDAHRKANTSLAVYEAAKWLGVLRVPFVSTVVDRNQDVIQDASLVNRFPYSKGWILGIKPDKPVSLEEQYKSAEQALKIYTRYLQEERIPDCVHCIGEEV